MNAFLSVNNDLMRLIQNLLQENGITFRDGSNIIETNYSSNLSSQEMRSLANQEEISNLKSREILQFDSTSQRQLQSSTHHNEAIKNHPKSNRPPIPLYSEKDKGWTTPLKAITSQESGNASTSARPKRRLELE